MPDSIERCRTCLPPDQVYVALVVGQEILQLADRMAMRVLAAGDSVFVETLEYQRLGRPLLFSGLPPMIGTRSSIETSEFVLASMARG